MKKCTLVTILIVGLSLVMAAPVLAQGYVTKVCVGNQTGAQMHFEKVNCYTSLNLQAKMPLLDPVTNYREQGQWYCWDITPAWNCKDDLNIDVKYFLTFPNNTSPMAPVNRSITVSPSGDWVTTQYLRARKTCSTTRSKPAGGPPEAGPPIPGQ